MTAEPTLGQLMDERRGRRSYEELARDCGGAPGAARLQQLARRPIKNYPDPETITALARGLGTSVTSVVMAISRSLGLRVFVGDDPNALVIGRAGLLPDGPREIVVGVAREMLALFDPHEQIVDIGYGDDGSIVYLTRDDIPADEAGAYEVPGATTAATAHTDDSAPADGLPSTASDQVLIVRQNQHIPGWTDVTTAEGDAEVAQQQLEVDDDLFSQWLSGQGGFDEVTDRRYRARADAEGVERETAPDDTAVAARTGESRDIEEHDRSLRRGEESQDPGGDDPR